MQLVQKIQTKSALHRVKGRFPYHWDLNIYRGCTHGCQYCFAKYSHNYLNSESFFSNLFVKENIAEILDKELSRRSWKKELVNIGGVTDSYQPIEAEIKLMPEILKIFIKHRSPVTISTKSDLILRDFDLIRELASVTDVNIAASITTPNENIRKLIEPGASTTLNRFRMLKTFKELNVTTGLHLMPIIPYLTDKPDDLETLFKMAASCEVDYVITGKLYLRGKTRPHFLSFMRDAYEEAFYKLSKLYNQKNWDDTEQLQMKKKYNQKLNTLLKHFRIKHHLTGVYKKPETIEKIQLKLFE